MRTTPDASDRLNAVMMLSTNYRMIPVAEGNAVVNFASVTEAAELADEYGLKLCLLDQKKERIEVDKNHAESIPLKYDMSRFTVAVSD